LARAVKRHSSATTYTDRRNSEVLIGATEVGFVRSTSERIDWIVLQEQEIIVGFAGDLSGCQNLLSRKSLLVSNSTESLNQQ